MAVAMVAASMMAVLTVGSVLAHGHVANDGQTLAMQSPEVQALFTSAHGDDAAAQWVSEHNAAIGPAQPATPAVSASADYFRVRHVAYTRSGDLDMADVIARGTVDQFLAGMDMGVIYGYVAPAPQPRAAPSTSTSSGPSTATSPSTSTVSGWGDRSPVYHYEVGQSVSLTLPTAPGAVRYTLTPVGSVPSWLDISSDMRKVSGRPTAPEEGVVFTYVAVGPNVDDDPPLRTTLTRLTR